MSLLVLVLSMLPFHYVARTYYHTNSFNYLPFILEIWNPRRNVMIF